MACCLFLKKLLIHDRIGPLIIMIFVFFNLSTLGGCGAEDANREASKKTPYVDDTSFADGCNKSQLNTCLLYNGGEACYSKWNCKKNEGQENSNNPNDENSSSSTNNGIGDNSACNSQQLKICLQYNGGDACYPKWKCIKGSTDIGPNNENGSNPPSNDADNGSGAKFEGKIIDTTLGNRLAQYVSNSAIGFTGRCWYYVQRAVNAVILNLPVGTISLPGNAQDNITRLSESRFKMCRANDTRLANLPVGSILIYRPGTCGFSAQYGHGEIKVSSNKFCSDGCQTARSSCPRADAAFFPCKK